MEIINFGSQVGRETEECTQQMQHVLVTEEN